MVTTAKRGIRSIEVGGRLLKALIHHAKPMMLKDLAAAADLVPAQAHAYLTSFRATGMVFQDPNNGMYRVGSFALRLSLGRIEQVPCLNQTIATVDRLANELGLMVTMTVLGPHGPTVVHVHQGDENPLDVNVRPGTLYSVTNTASGRAFAAFSKSPRVLTWIDSELSDDSRVTSLSKPITKKSFNLSIKTARKQKYAYATGEPIRGVNAASAPVYDDNGDFIAAITLIGRENDLDISEDSIPVKTLLETTNSIFSHVESLQSPKNTKISKTA